MMMLIRGKARKNAFLGGKGGDGAGGEGRKMGKMTARASVGGAVCVYVEFV